jgi:hypothetical protein
MLFVGEEQVPQGAGISELVKRPQAAVKGVRRKYAVSYISKRVGKSFLSQRFWIAGEI